MKMNTESQLVKAYLNNCCGANSDKVFQTLLSKKMQAKNAELGVDAGGQQKKKDYTRRYDTGNVGDKMAKIRYIVNNGAEIEYKEEG